MSQARTRGWWFTAVVAVLAVSLGAAACDSNGRKSTGTKNNNNPSSGGSFTAVGSLGTGRVGHTATLLSTGEVLVIGGKTQQGQGQAVVNSAELYNPQSGTWSVVPGTMASPRMNHAAARLATGNVVVLGGQSDVAGNQPLATCELYNAQSKTFTPVTGILPSTVSEPVAFAYDSAGVTEVIIAGGRTFVNNQQISVVSAATYRADSNTISPAANLLGSRYGASAARLPSGHILIQGGALRDQSTSFQDVPAGHETWDITAKIFKSHSGLQTNRFESALDLLGTQPAVFAGKATGGVNDRIEIFDEATNAWTFVTQKLAGQRFAHTATKLGSGNVLAAGGASGNNNVLGTSEVVKGTGVGATVDVGPDLKVARKNHTATLLNNGTVLVVGGEDQNNIPLAATEVFALSGTSVPTGPGGGVNPGGGTGGTGGTPPRPNITSLTPNTGPVGQQVTIAGTNFSATPAGNVVKYGTIVTPVQTVQAGTGGNTELKVVVPSGATGTLDVTVTVGAQVSNPMSFVVTSGSTTPGSGGGGSGAGAPHIYVVLPSSGTAGDLLSFIPPTPVLMAGTGFDVGAIPYFGLPPGQLFPGFPLLTISLQNFNVPLLGNLSLAASVIFLPGGAALGSSALQVQYLGQMSPPFMPFTVY